MPMCIFLFPLIFVEYLVFVIAITPEAREDIAYAWRTLKQKLRRKAKKEKPKSRWIPAPAYTFALLITILGYFILR